MLTFKIIYYCYFTFFDVIVFGQLNRETVVKLLSLALMSMFSTSLLALLVYFTAALNINADLKLGISFIFILLFYMLLVNDERHNGTISRVKKMRKGYRVISFIVIYSLTILVFIVYVKSFNSNK